MKVSDITLFIYNITKFFIQPAFAKYFITSFFFQDHSDINFSIDSFGIKMIDQKIWTDKERWRGQVDIFVRELLFLTSSNILLLHYN